MVITTGERSVLRPARRTWAEARPAARRRARPDPPHGLRRAAVGRRLAELARAYAWSRVLGG